MHTLSRALILIAPLLIRGTIIGLPRVAVNPQPDVVCLPALINSPLPADRGSIRALLHLTAPDAFRLVLGAFFALALALTTALQGVLLGPMLRMLVGGATTPQTTTGGLSTRLMPLTFASRPWDRHAILLSLGLLAGARAALAFGEGVVWAAITERLAHRLRADFFRAILHCPYEEFEQLSAGVLATRLTHDTEVAAHAATSVSGALVRDGVMVLVLSGAAAVLSPWLFCVAAMVWPLVGLGLRRSAHTQREHSVGALTHRDTLAAWAAALSGSMAPVRLLGIREAVTHAFAEASQAYSTRERQRARSLAATSPLTELTASLGLLGALSLTSRLSATGLDRTLAFFYALFMAYRPLKSLGTLQSAASAGSVALRALTSLTMAREAPATAPSSLESSEITVHRGPLTLQLRGKLNATPGTLTAIVGTSGAGKTSILDALASLRPCVGELSYDGLARDGRELRIAYAQQECLLLPGTLGLNLGPEADERQARHLLERVGLGAWLERLPNGFATRVGPGGVSPSVGERKRIAVVRALLNHAPMVFLDEPTAGLDSASAERVCDLLADQRSLGRTVIVVTHDERLAARCDQRLDLSSSSETRVA